MCIRDRCYHCGMPMDVTEEREIFYLAPKAKTGVEDADSYTHLDVYKRQALFVIISDTDDTFNFVVSIMYTQLFNLLCDLSLIHISAVIDGR